MSAAGERLQKALAAAGLGSRREIEGWIRAGRLAVNGRTATLGQRVQPADLLTLDGQPLRPRAAAGALRVLAYNKPEGEICSRRDPEGRPSVFERLPRLRGGRWVLVGRLDLNTAGLLLVTDSGELANRLMHPASRIEREYLVRVNGEVEPATLERLRRGVELEDGHAAFDEVQARGGEGRNRWYTVVLREGRNREVRRLWESQGCSVSRLKRVRFGPVSLGPGERRGHCRELGADEVAALCAAVGFQPLPAAVPAPAPARAAAKRQRAATAPAARRRESGGEEPRRRGPAPGRGLSRRR